MVTGPAQDRGSRSAVCSTSATERGALDPAAATTTAASDSSSAPTVTSVFDDMKKHAWYLIAGGVFEDAAGLVVGRPFGYDSEKQRRDYAGVITGLLCDGPLAEKEFPILFGVDFGHTTPMVTLPYDAMAELDSERDSFAVVEPVVV